jgi:[acyl-carrier-protein] S-malonyltransferase
MARLAILCSGQGMQQADMFDRLLQYPECEKFLENVLNSNFLVPEVKDWFKQSKSSEEMLFNNLYAQEFICLYQLMLWEKLKTILPEAYLFAGYSLGEIIAYGCAGALSPEQTITLVRERAQIMTSSTTTQCGMLAVKGLTENTVAELCRDYQCSIAIYNPGNHFIIGGLRDNIEKLTDACQNAGAEKVVQLKINVPSHTPLLQRASDKFREVLTKADFKPDPSKVILEGITGRRVFNKKQAVNALADQLSHPVMWERNAAAMVEYGCGIFLELGPGHALARMVSEVAHHGEARSVEEFHDLNELPAWLKSSSNRL